MLNSVFIFKDALRGGLSEVYSHHWSKDEALSESTNFHDIVSLYPWVCMNTSLPIGDYKALVGNDLEWQTNPEGTELLINGKKHIGLAYLTILPPRKLDAPFLLHRTPDERSIACLCRTCG